MKVNTGSGMKPNSLRPIPEPRSPWSGFPIEEQEVAIISRTRKFLWSEALVQLCCYPRV